MIKSNDDGFHAVALSLFIVVLAVIGFTAFTVLKHQDQGSAQNTDNKTPRSAQKDSGLWQFDRQQLSWSTAGKSVPACPDPLFSTSPVDMTLVSAVGLPGQYRGGNYKAHGGFRLADSSDGSAEIRLPMDANLTSIKRYYESIPGQPDELQYLVDFENDCGIAYRFDHLHTLSADLQSLAEKTAPPKKNDTRSDPGAQPLHVAFQAGTVIATKVGFPQARNYGFDFGAYDRRARNTISGNAKWAGIHKDFADTAYYGVCWIPLLPGNDATRAEAIAKDRNTYDTNKPFNLTSDYCQFAPHKTLEFNDGQPTDG